MGLLIWLISLYTTTTIQYQAPIKVGVPNENVMYRITYYHDGDAYGSGKCTASGICTNRLDINEKGWYTYKDRLVIATGYEYKMYDKLIVNIKGVDYPAIVLDKCGACRRDTRIDLYVKDKDSGIDMKGVGVRYEEDKK